MNNPNPLIPQGSLLEQQAKSKPHLRIALFIVAVHVVFLGLLLMQGCKREPESTELAEASTNDYPFGVPDRSTLFASNIVSDLDPAPAQEPVMDLRDAEGGFADPGSEQPGAEPRTNVTTDPVVPQVQTPSPAEPQLVSREHVVASGDTFYTIGKKYGVSSTAIAQANPNADAKRLQVGQRLLIPPPSTAPRPGTPDAALPPGVEWYQVKSGDTLTRIAGTRGTTPAAIRQLNGMTTDRIYVGQKLKLPSKTNAVAAPSNP
jgi:LysM repeat protein